MRRNQNFEYLTRKYPTYLGFPFFSIFFLFFWGGGGGGGGSFSLVFTLQVAAQGEERERRRRKCWTILARRFDIVDLREC